MVATVPFCRSRAPLAGHSSHFSVAFFTPPFCFQEPSASRYVSGTLGMESRWRSSRVAEAVTRSQPLCGMDERWRPSADALFFFCADEAASTHAEAFAAHFGSD